MYKSYCFTNIQWLFIFLCSFFSILIPNYLLLPLLPFRTISYNILTYTSSFYIILNRIQPLTFWSLSRSSMLFFRNRYYHLFVLEPFLMIFDNILRRLSTSLVAIYYTHRYRGRILTLFYRQQNQNVFNINGM